MHPRFIDKLGKGSRNLRKSAKVVTVSLERVLLALKKWSTSKGEGQVGIDTLELLNQNRMSGSSLGLRPRELPWAQAIFHSISLLSS